MKKRKDTFCERQFIYHRKIVAVLYEHSQFIVPTVLFCRSCGIVAGQKYGWLLSLQYCNVMATTLSVLCMPALLNGCLDKIAHGNCTGLSPSRFREKHGQATLWGIYTHMHLLYSPRSVPQRRPPAILFTTLMRGRSRPHFCFSFPFLCFSVSPSVPYP